MPSTTTPAGRPEFHEELRKIREDPQVMTFALAHARGDLDLAQDGVDDAYWAVGRVRHPEQIVNLRAYFYRTVSNAINRLRNQLGAVLVEDFEAVAETHQDKPGCHPLPPRPLDDAVSLSLLTPTWLEPFAARRAELITRVPGRSPDRALYRDVIVTIAERLLLAIIIGDVCDADANPALCAAYPGWFAEPDAAENTLHQRYSRARADVRGLLQGIINRDDLHS
jgi:hypothetical protein